jgi:hypothetical protein
MNPQNLTETEIRHRTWIELERAAFDRHHEWRTPVLATVGQDGTPSARTVVLRQASVKSQSLQFFTDRRSQKTDELIHQPSAVVVFWSKRLNWQLRVRVEIDVQTTGLPVEELWKRIRQSPAAGDYLSADAPGSQLPAQSAEPGNGNGVHHLAILVSKVQEIDWLELGRGGHRRATFATDTWCWRVP